MSDTSIRPQPRAWKNKTKQKCPQSMNLLGTIISFTLFDINEININLSSLPSLPGRGGTIQHHLLNISEPQHNALLLEIITIIAAIDRIKGIICNI